MKIAGAILCGGKNKRMGGRNKSFLNIDGIALIERQLKIFESIFEEIILVAGSLQEYKQYQNRCSIISDIIKNCGPLGGIHAALEYTSKDAVFFVACDMPNLHNETIKKQLAYFQKARTDVLVPRMGDKIEPLHSIYRKGAEKEIERYLKTGKTFSVRGFFKNADTEYFLLPDTPRYREIFANINTLDDMSFKTKGRRYENKI